jgi:hypothetical protein
MDNVQPENIEGNEWKISQDIMSRLAKTQNNNIHSDETNECKWDILRRGKHI